MVKFASVLFIGFVLSFAPGVAAATSQSEAATACARAADKSFDRAWRLEPSLRFTIEAHRSRMKAICLAWDGAEAGGRGKLLADCFAEAARGPRHIQRGRNSDRAQIAEQRRLCRALAAEAGAR